MRMMYYSVSDTGILGKKKHAKTKLLFENELFCLSLTHSMIIIMKGLATKNVPELNTHQGSEFSARRADALHCFLS